MTAITHDQSTGEPLPAPADWATLLAGEIIADVHRYSYINAVKVIAGRLRIVEARGAQRGVSEFARALDQPSPAELQRETAKDAEEELSGVFR